MSPMGEKLIGVGCDRLPLYIFDCDLMVLLLLKLIVWGQVDGEHRVDVAMIISARLDMANVDIFMVNHTIYGTMTFVLNVVMTFCACCGKATLQTFCQE